MKARIEVTYNISEVKDIRAIDNFIRKLIKSIGGKWYAQGANLDNGMRDICFDLKIPVKELNSERS